MIMVTATDADFVLDWQLWHHEHETRRADVHGFLAITSLNWLDETPTRFDDAPGWWSTSPSDGIVLDLAEGESVVVDGVTVTGRYVFGHIPERGGVNVVAGDAVIEVARRGGNDIVRPRHPHSSVLVSYRGTPTFAPDLRWRRPAVYRPYDVPQDVTVGAVVDGLQHVYAAPGVLEVEIGGVTHRLVAFDGHRPGELSVLFTDETSGDTTYAANRSLTVSLPVGGDDGGDGRDDAAAGGGGGGGGATVVDFNRATNLPCAYTSFATCPLPPAGNHLPVAVEAGERFPFETV